ncbi:MAG: tRNA pseudouridine(55) synthase TruB [Synergistaceae bacterium]|nr:tRNA pseudouridine(55) synthase TruB [Synergistaceae bacterium]
MNALILINKPEGLRSSKCVGIVKRKLKFKVGHSGTLDSTASGLLIILVGHATRLCEYVMSLPKVYRAKIQFGVETDTYDYSGNVLSEKGFENFNPELINDFMYSFSGWRLQTPPAVSAIKIEGRPAYKLFRSGSDVEMKARPVFFRNIKILSPFNQSDGTMELEISCGRGTYIRSLAHDLGKISGCGAFIKSLTRTSIGNFNLSDSNSPDDEKFKIVTMSELAKNFMRVNISDKDEKTFSNGLSILLSHGEKFSRGFIPDKNLICVEGGKILGFGEYVGYDYIKPVTIVSKV